MMNKQWGALSFALYGGVLASSRVSNIKHEGFKHEGSGYCDLDLTQHTFGGMNGHWIVRLAFC